MHTLSLSLRAALASASVFCVAAAQSAAVGYSEDWNGGDFAGWFANTTSSTVVNPGAGGDPDGYLLSRRNGGFSAGATTDVADAAGNFAPGEWRANVDLLGVVGATSDVWLRFRFQDSTFNGWRYRLDDVLSDTWTTYTVVFNTTWTDAEAALAGWATDLPDGFASVSWAQTMSNVYRSEVRADGSSTLALGIDNFQLIGPSGNVPLPMPLALFGVGAILLTGVRGRGVK
jgi:hypothetical protein